MTITTDISSDYKHIFANDPIVITAVTTAADVPGNATLARLVIGVIVHLANDITHLHEIPQQFMPGDTLYADISSALKAEYQLVDRHNEPSPALVENVIESQQQTTEIYEPFRITITAQVRYLQNSEEKTGASSTVMDGIYVLRGGLQPQLRQRLANSPSAAVLAFANLMTTKPHVPANQILLVNDLQQHPQNPVLLEMKNIGDVQTETSYDTTTHKVTTTATPVTSSSSQIWIKEYSRFRRQLVFRNSLGVLETFSVFCYEKEMLSVKSEEYTILSNPTYSPKQNLLTQAQNPSLKWEMSTGYMPLEWTKWFIREVLTAEYTWMYVPIINPKTGETTSVYLPVHLETEETTTQDETTAQLHEVKFNVVIPPVA